MLCSGAKPKESAIDRSSWPFVAKYLGKPWFAAQGLPTVARFTENPKSSQVGVEIKFASVHIAASEH